MAIQRKPIDLAVLAPGQSKPSVRSNGNGSAPQHHRRPQRYPANGKPGAGGHRAAFAALKSLSANLPAPPTTYDTTKQYRVQLSASVEINNRWLRPSQDVVVSGAFAQTIASSISGAQVVG